MLFCESFSKRLALLRTTYQLPTVILAKILKLKSRTSINDFESQRTNPSVDVLLNISKLFGVSLDWLSGYSNTPYVAEVLLSYEEEFINETGLRHPDIRKHADINYLYQVLVFSSTATSDYLGANRDKHFSLPVRANILFSLNVIKYFAKVFSSEGYNAQKEQVGYCISKLLKGTKSHHLAGLLCYSCYDTIEYFFKQYLLRPNSFMDIPKFDITKPKLDD